MCAMRVTVTGATGLIGPQLVAELRERGAQVTVLTRDPARARAALGEVEAVAWELLGEPAPARALAGRDAVIHLAGEPVAQRWSARAKQAIRDSRVIGTRNLVDGLTRAHEAQDDQPPRTLIGSSAIGYYGAHGEEPLDEDAPPGGDFLSRVCVEWEDAAAAARELGTRVVHVRTGVVLDRAGGALAKMLPAFRLGVGGPVAGGARGRALERAGQRDRARAGAQPRLLEGPRQGARAALAAARAGLRAARAVRRDCRDRHHRRARASRQTAGARLPVRAPPAGAGAQAGAGTRARCFSVSMITRQGRLLSR
jgi:nucleoside-diphosphate-sugar epimerase